RRANSGSLGSHAVLPRSRAPGRCRSPLPGGPAARVRADADPNDPLLAAVRANVGAHELAGVPPPAKRGTRVRLGARTRDDRVDRRRTGAVPLAQRQTPRLDAE